MLDRFAEQLKKARLKKGISLQQIAAKTRIDIKFLEAIDNGNFSFLPDLYVKEFLRQYAKSVDLDENETIKKYDDALNGKFIEDDEPTNSQDYVGRFEVVPGKQPNSVRLAPVAMKAIATKKHLPPWLDFIATYAPYIARRDFICWLSVVLAALQVTQIIFGMFVVGGLISFVILTVDHIKLRSLRRSIERRGMLLEAP